jgi:hypothetical protein
LELEGSIREWKEGLIGRKDQVGRKDQARTKDQVEVK